MGESRGESAYSKRFCKCKEISEQQIASLLYSTLSQLLNLAFLEFSSYKSMEIF